MPDCSICDKVIDEDVDDYDINDFQIFQKGKLFDSDVVYTHTECRVKENSKDEATD